MSKLAQPHQKEKFCSAKDVPQQKHFIGKSILRRMMTFIRQTMERYVRENIIKGKQKCLSLSIPVDSPIQLKQLSISIESLVFPGMDSLVLQHWMTASAAPPSFVKEGCNNWKY